MCSPQLYGLATMAGATVQAGGEYQAGRFNSKVAAEAAKFSDMAALDAYKRGSSEESRYRVSMRQLEGQQIAQMAAAGGDFSGSNMDILRDQADTNAIDISTIRANAAREAFGFKVQSYNYRAQSKLDKRTGLTRAAGTLLGGGAGAYNIGRIDRGIPDAVLRGAAGGILR